MTSGCSQLAGVFPIAFVRLMHLLTIFLDKLTLPYGISNYVLPENDLQFDIKFLTKLCFFLVFDRSKATPILCRQTVGSGKTLAHWSPECIIAFKHQEDWVVHVQTLKYAYSLQTPRATGTSAFSSVPQRELTTAATLDKWNRLASNMQREVLPRHMTLFLL